MQCGTGHVQERAQKFLHTLMNQTMQIMVIAYGLELLHLEDCHRGVICMVANHKIFAIKWTGVPL